MDEQKMKGQLIKELESLRQQVAQPAALESGHEQAQEAQRQL